MDSVQLGKKLKEARLAKKMTQSDVVGSFITRNMLSQIESGAAFPSIRTLEYLANALEIPVHYLIPAESAEKPVLLENAELHTPPARTDATEIFLTCKREFVAGNFSYIIARASALSDKNGAFYDEGAALLARAYLQTAKRFLRENEPKKAVGAAREAAKFGSEGIYAAREVRTEALLMLDELAEKINGD